jgi:lipopolysaccharide/colanic/teichoic acid biosynthesis glycosyltransferase
MTNTVNRTPIKKRILDIILAAAGLALASPLFFFCIGMTYCQMSRPIFFRQERLGKDGRIFKLWKFRTMLINAQQIVRTNPKFAKMYEVNYKIPCCEDFLVTRWGRIMRKTSLDELPQLFNILQGDMSVVGPRPIVPPEIEEYGSYGQKLLSVKPGLTGYWQVSGRNKIRYPERIFFDMYYIDHQTTTFDLKIMARTFWALLTMDGSI